jgi:hypothetical protein
MPHLGEGCGELLHAFRYPHQRPHGIAQRGGLDQALERREELGVDLAKRTTPATGSANPPLWQRLPIEIVLAAIDRRAGEPGNLRDKSQDRLDLRRAPRRPQKAVALARQAASRPCPTADESRPRRSCNRATPIRPRQESTIPESIRRTPAGSDSVIVRCVLSIIAVNSDEYRPHLTLRWCCNFGDRHRW